MWTDWQNKVKPNAQIPHRLLWDMDMTDWDWQKNRKIVVERVIERGRMDDFYTLFKLYGGIDNVKEIIKEIHYLSNRDIAFVCATFDLKKEELGCYIRKQLRKQLMNY